MQNIMQGSVIQPVNGFSEALVVHKRITGIGVMVLSMHATDIMPMRQGRQTVQALSVVN